MQVQQLVRLRAFQPDILNNEYGTPRCRTVGETDGNFRVLVRLRGCLRDHSLVEGALNLWMVRSRLPVQLLRAHLGGCAAGR